MDDKSTILVVSTVPTTGYLIMQGLVDFALYALMAVIAYFLLQKAGIDILKYLKGATTYEDPKQNQSKPAEPKATPATDKQATKKTEEATVELV